jgi:large subunit ribosomal protein L1
MGKKQGDKPADSAVDAAEKKKEKKAPESVPPVAAATPPAERPAAPAPQAAELPPAEGAKKRKPGSSPPRGKKLKNITKQFKAKVAKAGAVPLRQALEMLKSQKRVKFDETVEIHMHLGIDAKQSDQMVRGAVALPHGIGKSVRLLVFTQGENANKAREAGADFVGGDDLAKKIQSESWLDFDVALATPDMMGVVGRLGKILGPRGLMPSPKAGTVITGDVAAAIKEFKAGKVEYRADAGGNVHAPVGKMSFDVDKLAGNAHAFIEQIRAAKPASAKGNYINSITVSATMSPGVPVQA